MRAKEEDLEGDTSLDATWELLEKSRRIPASPRFVDDTVRAVRLLPGRNPWLTGLFSIGPWAGVAACGALAAMFLIHQPPAESSVAVTPVVSSEAKWSEIEDVADAEMLSAAVDHLDRFSDQELVTLIGF